MNQETRKQGVLVTGAPRSGSTWVGKMLALAEGTRYLHEPLNNRFTVEHFKEEPFPYWFMYIDDFNEKEYISKVARMLQLPPASVAEGYPVVKDPISVFSSPWLARTFNLDVVMLVRHPAAFVRSILELQWNTRPKMLFRQTPLVEAWLSPMENELREQQQRQDPLTDAAFMWKGIHFVVVQYLERNPQWTLLRHEDLAREPHLGFRKLYTRLGLDYNEKIAKKIDKHSNAGNPTNPRHHWQVRRNSRETVRNWYGYFTEEQLKTIRSIVEPVSRHFYSDAEWPSG